MIEMTVASPPTSGHQQMSALGTRRVHGVAAGGLGLLCVLAAAALAAYGLHAAHHHRRRSALLSVSPDRRTVSPGSVTTFQVIVDRRRFRGRVRMRVKGLPRAASARL